ncbi:hypothetical protein C0V72_12805 [Porphyrobacter sp. TH134]|uniref:hypothetical protein n=1 Tax=Porphyrobacter sp. TH134 TaxID=2067450 RepID=UPI000C79F9A6|nr:hypothetical protein [Porphyrobacter sp. TH134]PLK22827.1 hypothetical protein C0V72_12805 [Porphyrobacter sp. TH134]
MPFFNPLKVSMIALAGLVLVPGAGHAQTVAPAMATAADGPTYADLATLSDASELVVRVQIRRQTVLKPDRAPGLAAGFARLYIEADTTALIAGRSGVGAALTYLADVPLDARGKVPKLKKREFLLFARPVAGRPGEVQLVSPAAQLAYTPELEARLRPILTELYAAEGAAPRITGIGDALAVQGTLTGESETQIFLTTENRSPVSITVLRRPGQRPQWGVSWGEIIDSAARPPVAETLRWYRLACSLPAQLPSGANLAREPEARRLAAGDYAFVREALGPCERRITRG